jgi:hypothetical protein
MLNILKYLNIETLSEFECDFLDHYLLQRELNERIIKDYLITQQDFFYNNIEPIFKDY